MEIKLGRSSGAPRQKILLGCLCLLVGLRAGSAMILGEALGATNAIWRTGGDAPWFVETNTIRGGLASLRSRSEEHTSELQSLTNLVCRLLLEKKKTTI